MGPGLSFVSLPWASQMLGVGCSLRISSQTLDKRITERVCLTFTLPGPSSPEILIQLGLASGPKTSALTSPPGAHMIENTSFENFLFFNLNLEALCSFIFSCSCRDSVHMCICFLIKEFPLWMPAVEPSKIIGLTCPLLAGGET